LALAKEHPRWTCQLRETFSFLILAKKTKRGNSGKLAKGSSLRWTMIFTVMKDRIPTRSGIACFFCSFQGGKRELSNIATDGSNAGGAKSLCADSGPCNHSGGNSSRAGPHPL
jgi:hypothetical protein